MKKRNGKKSKKMEKIVKGLAHADRHAKKERVSPQHFPLRATPVVSYKGSDLVYHVSAGLGVGRCCFYRLSAGQYGEWSATSKRKVNQFFGFQVIRHYRGVLQYLNSHHKWVDVKDPKNILIVLRPKYMAL